MGKMRGKMWGNRDIWCTEASASVHQGGVSVSLNFIRSTAYITLQKPYNIHNRLHTFRFMFSGYNG